MDIRAVKDLASRLFGERKFERSLALFERLIQLQPADAFAFLRHAQAAERLGLKLLAVGSYRRAGQLWKREGRGARAASAFRLALALEPADALSARGLTEVAGAPPRPHAWERPRVIELGPEEPAAPEPARRPVPDLMSEESFFELYVTT
jgi:tetratricopeptide (TPR) repeat protein